MPKGIEFTLTANKCSIKGQIYHKPFKIALPLGHPKIPSFKNHPAFSSKNIYIPEKFVAEPPPKPVEPKEPVEPIIEGTPLNTIEGMKPDWVEVLAKIGINTAEELLSDDFTHDDLTALHGIGDATADKIISLCEEAVDDSEE